MNKQINNKSIGIFNTPYDELDSDKQEYIDHVVEQEEVNPDNIF